MMIQKLKRKKQNVFSMPFFRLQEQEERTVWNAYKSSKIIAGQIPPNPKGFLANERTFLHWLNLVVVLCAIGLSLVNSSLGSLFTVLGTLFSSGILFTMIGSSFAAYALGMYHIRSNLLEGKQKGEKYEDIQAAVVLVIVVILSVGVNFILHFLYFAMFVRCHLHLKASLHAFSSRFALRKNNKIGHPRPIPVNRVFFLSLHFPNSSSSSMSTFILSAKKMLRHIRFLSKRTKLQLLKNGLPPKLGVKDATHGKRDSPGHREEKFVEAVGTPQISGAIEKGSKQGRVYWYSDPHLLSEAIEKIFKSSRGNTLPIVLDLIERHSASTNAQVFGLVFKELLSLLHSRKAESDSRLEARPNTQQRGLDTKSIVQVDSEGNIKDISAAFHHLLSLLAERKITLTDQGKTSVLALLCEIPSNQHPKDFLNENNSTHLALYFKYSSRMGSTEECIPLYQNYVARETPNLELCTGFMMVLAKKPSAEHWKWAKSIFRSLEEYDSLFLTSYLQLLYHFEPHIALELIHEHYGYPKTHKDSLRPARFKMELPTLTVLLYVAGKLQYPRLAQRWISLSGLELDLIGKRALADVYLQSREYEMAWNIYHDDAEFGLRICALGARSRDTVWYKRSKEFQLVGFRSVINCLWAYLHLKKKEEGLELIIQHRTVLLDDVLRNLESCILEKRELSRSDLFRINSVEMIKKFLVGDTIVVRLLQKKCTEIEEMRSLYNQNLESCDTTKNS
jgi:uncharacterized membrane protein YidH (DUF202 family)